MTRLILAALLALWLAGCDGGAVSCYFVENGDIFYAPFEESCPAGWTYSEMSVGYVNKCPAKERREREERLRRYRAEADERERKREAAQLEHTCHD